jgi:hypothetical protein
MRPHTYLPDPDAVDRPGGEPRCAACGLPRANKAAHDVPEVSKEARELESRMLGEPV